LILSGCISWNRGGGEGQAEQCADPLHSSSEYVFHKKLNPSVGDRWQTTFRSRREILRLETLAVADSTASV
jgi:hypothetical protein